jgi:hypothetical protein
LLNLPTSNYSFFLSGVIAQRQTKFNISRKYETNENAVRRLMVILAKETPPLVTT